MIAFFKTAFLGAGFLVTASSNILNQLIEKDSDKLMSRTQNRPLPTGILSVNEGLILAEIELKSKNEQFTPPEWLSKEVSEDENYFNSNFL